jgi:hypothetical protein
MKKNLALLLFWCFAFTSCNQPIDSKSENITTTTPATISTESVTITTTTQTTNKSNINNRNYIGNKNSQVLHVSTCDSLPYEQNRVYFSTIPEALNKGYRKHYECMGN